MSSTVSAAVEQLKHVLNSFLEALAVMLVTSCLIPVLVLVFFVWFVKLLLGAQLPPPRLSAPKAADAPDNGQNQ